MENVETANKDIETANKDIEKENASTENVSIENASKHEQTIKNENNLLLTFLNFLKLRKLLLFEIALYSFIPFILLTMIQQSFKLEAKIESVKPLLNTFNPLCQELASNNFIFLTNFSFSQNILKLFFFVALTLFLLVIILEKLLYKKITIYETENIKNFLITFFGFTIILSILAYSSIYYIFEKTLNIYMECTVDKNVGDEFVCQFNKDFNIECFKKFKERRSDINVF